MTPLRTTIALMIMMVCVLIVAGCIWQPPAENCTSNISVNVTPLTSVVTPVQTQCAPPVETSLPVWITMNPITDHHLGDVFEVNGTIQQKNWTIETEEKIHVRVDAFSPGLHFYGPEGIASQHISDCEVKTWSYQVNLSRNWPLGEYRIYIYSMNGYGSHTRIFNVTPLNSETLLSGGR